MVVNGSWRKQCFVEIFELSEFLRSFSLLEQILRIL
jgi:hypothetical protein